MEQSVRPTTPDRPRRAATSLRHVRAPSGQQARQTPAPSDQQSGALVNTLPTPVALVAGADGGLGLEVARQLSLTGAVVLVAAPTAEAAKDAVVDLPALEALGVDLDVTDDESVTGCSRRSGGCPRTSRHPRQRHGVRGPDDRPSVRRGDPDRPRGGAAAVRGGGVRGLAPDEGLPAPAGGQRPPARGQRQQRGRLATVTR